MSDPEINVSLTNYARGWNDAIEAAAKVVDPDDMMRDARGDIFAADIRKLSKGEEK